jgi:uncharacterized RDD family membrane protein YckC
VSEPALDTQYRVEAPEGVALALRPAGVVARTTAFAIDLFIRMSLLSVMAVLLEPFAGIGAAFWLLLAFGLEWFYPVAFELTPGAATPGKLAVGLRVVMDNGLPVTASASLLRNLLRAADFLPLAYGLGLASMLMRSDFKRLGDIAASTLVVYRPTRTAPQAWPAAAPEPPAVSLGFDQQRALLHLAGRAGRLTPERADELALIATPGVWPGHPAPAEPAARLAGVARWLRGER